MPSTRKQKAKERRSRQLDIMSDTENVDIMLGSYARDDERIEQSENEMNLDSGSNRPHQNSNLVGEECRGDLISPWWTEGPTGFSLAQGRVIPPWWTKGPVVLNGTPK